MTTNSDRNLPLPKAPSFNDSPPKAPAWMEPAPDPFASADSPFGADKHTPPPRPAPPNHIAPWQLPQPAGLRKFQQMMARVHHTVRTIETLRAGAATIESLQAIVKDEDVVIESAALRDLIAKMHHRVLADIDDVTRQLEHLIRTLLPSDLRTITNDFINVTEYESSRGKTFDVPADTFTRVADLLRNLAALVQA